MSPLHRTLLGIAIAGMAAVGQAATVQVKFDADIFNGVATPQFDVVSIKFPKNPSNGVETLKNVAAGRFQGTVQSFAGVDKTIFVDGLNDLYMYCYDVYESVGGNWVVDYSISFSAPERTLDFLGAVNHVLNAGKTVADPHAWLRPTTAAAAAAIQLGIWESKYETDKAELWNIHNGSFKAQDLDVDTKKALKDYFSAIDSSVSLGEQWVMTLEAAGAQDMITGDPPPAPVPEPGTLALLTVAAVGLVSTRRRAPSPIA